MADQLADAVGQQQAAVRSLETAVSQTEGWRDEQRAALERSRLTPMLADAQRLLAQLQQAATQLAAARARLNR